MSEKKVVVITGASDGIGAAAARRLHTGGHTVVAVGRSPQKTRAIAAELGVASHVADFTRLEDVERLASELNANYPRIDVLANNAGGVFGERTKTVDGFEKTFQINHLAPFLDDLDHDRNYDPVHAYGAAKLANILFTTALHRRYHAVCLAAASFYPGNVLTNFASDTTSPIMRTVRFLGTRTPLGRVLLSTPKQGADQIVWLAEETPGTTWQSGAYYYKRQASVPRNPQALDTDLARRFWERSEELLTGRLPDPVQ